MPPSKRKAAADASAASNKEAKSAAGPWLKKMLSTLTTRP